MFLDSELKWDPTVRRMDWPQEEPVPAQWPGVAYGYGSMGWISTFLMHLHDQVRVGLSLFPRPKSAAWPAVHGYAWVQPSAPTLTLGGVRSGKSTYPCLLHCMGSCRYHDCVHLQMIPTNSGVFWIKTATGLPASTAVPGWHSFMCFCKGLEISPDLLTA